MKTSIFDMNFTLPPVVEMTEVVKDMPALSCKPGTISCNQLGEHMKTSIFDMNFVLPPLVEMTEVEKDMPMGTFFGTCEVFCQENT